MELEKLQAKIHAPAANACKDVGIGGLRVGVCTFAFHA
jgi:hypothetical protein